MTKRLGISDLKLITQTLKNLYGYDYNDYSFTFYKRVLENLFQLYNIYRSEDFVYQIEKDSNFQEVLHEQLVVEETEMFRDPTMWRYLKTSIFPRLQKTGQFSIWLPEVSTGEELFTLAITLKEAGLLEQVNIFATSISKRRIEYVKRGSYELKKIQNNDANYKRYRSDADLGIFYNEIENKGCMDTSLLRNVELKHISIGQYPSFPHVKLILYRNKFIYMSQTLQAKTMLKLNESLMPAGIFAVGIKESIDSNLADNKLSVFFKEEHIYKKS